MLAYLLVRTLFFFMLLGTRNCCATTASYGGNVASFFATHPSLTEQAFTIDNISFTSDVPLSRHEFFYVTDLKENTTITKDDIDGAYKRLMAKNRFEKISFDTIEKKNNTNLHVQLTGQWIFNTIIFKGIWFGSSSLAHLYLQQAGEPFDPLVHEESVKNITAHLHDSGFFDCVVRDHLTYHKKEKLIVVTLYIDKKTPYKLSSLDISTKKGTSAEILQVLEPHIKQARDDLRSEHYSKKSLTSFANRSKKILKKKGYSGIRLFYTKRLDNKKHTVAVCVRIQTEKRRNITFAGNTVLSTPYILEDIIAQQIPDWLFSPDILAQQLLHEYFKKGYWRIHVSYKKLGPDTYHYTIAEGNPITISAIDVHGPKQALDHEVAELVAKLKQVNADQAMISTILDDIKTWYLTHGYWDFAVDTKDFVKNSDGKTYTMKLHLTEGKQRLWAGFKIKHAKTLMQHEFFRKFRKPKQGEKVPCNIGWISEQRQFILNHYLQQGYWYADAQPSVVAINKNNEQSQEAQRVFIVWNVHPGPLVKFGKIITQGYTSVPFHRIQKHVLFTEGALWDRKKIELTRKKLRQLDVFKSIHIQPAQLSKKQRAKNIFINLVDDDPLELRARVGYYFNSGNKIFSELNTAKVGASVIIKNPTNRADKLGLEGDWNTFEKKLVMHYQQPNPLDLRGTGKTQLYINKLIHPVEIAHSGSAYHALIYGAKGSMENEYKDHYFWHLGFGNEWATINKVQGNLNFDPQLLNKPLPYFFIEPRITIDTLDDRINTTKGSLTQASIKFILPESKGDLEAKVCFEQSLFFPLHERLVLASRFNFGHIFRSKFNKVLPHERFYLGGPTTVRGYGQDAIPPLGTSQRVVNGKTITDYTIQGGSSMINGNIELRYSLYKAVGITLFQDVGILSQDGIEGFKRQWYPGSGVGVRYKTPIGAIRFDVGWKWKKRLPLDSMTPEFYITFNEAF